MKNKFIVYIIILSTFLGSVSFFIPNASAQQPPGADVLLTYRFTSLDRKGLEITQTQPATIKFDFSWQQELTSPPPIKDVSVLSGKNYDEFHLFAMTNPTAVCKVPMTTTESSIFLITGRNKNLGLKHRQIGIYYKSAGSPGTISSSGTTSAVIGEYTLITQSFWLGDSCSITGGDKRPVSNIITTANANRFTEINWGVSTGDKESICRDISTRWSGVISGLTELLPDPNSGEPNTNLWVKNVGQPGTIRKIFLGTFFQVASATPGLSVGYSNAALGLGIINKIAPKWLNEATWNYELTSEGENVFRTVYENASKIREELDQVSGGNLDTWPCTEKLKKMFPKTDDDFYTSANDLIKDLDEYLTQFQSWISEVGVTQSTRDNDSVCGKVSGSALGAMLREVTCVILLWIKDFNDTAYSYALGLLTSSIGVATEQQYKPTTSKTKTATNQTVSIDDLKTQAVALCNTKKAATFAGDWNKGLCLEENINNSGYAVDVAHSPRLSIDDSNVCSAPQSGSGYIELNVSDCSVIKVSNGSN